MTIAGFTVRVLSGCVASYDPKKLPLILAYCQKKGCEVKTLGETARNFV